MKKYLLLTAICISLLNFLYPLKNCNSNGSSSLSELFTKANAAGESGLWDCRSNPQLVNVIYYSDGRLAYEHYTYGSCVGSQGLCITGSIYFAYSYYGNGSHADMTDCTSSSHC